MHNLATRLAEVSCDGLLLASSANVIILTFVFVSHKLFWRGCLALPPSPAALPFCPFVTSISPTTAEKLEGTSGGLVTDPPPFPHPFTAFYLLYQGGHKVGEKIPWVFQAIQSHKLHRLSQQKVNVIMTFTIIVMIPSH